MSFSLRTQLRRQELVFQEKEFAASVSPTLTSRTFLPVETIGERNTEKHKVFTQNLSKVWNISLATLSNNTAFDCLTENWRLWFRSFVQVCIIGKSSATAAATVWYFYIKQPSMHKMQLKPWSPLFKHIVWYRGGKNNDSLTYVLSISNYISSYKSQDCSWIKENLFWTSHTIAPSLLPSPKQRKHINVNYLQ